jgi:hypothetical protein
MRDNSEELVLRMEAAARESKNALGKLKAEKARQQAGDAIKGMGKIFPKGIRHPDSLVRKPGAVIPGLGKASVLFPGHKPLGSPKPVARSTVGGMFSTTIVSINKNTNTNTKTKYKLL